MLWASAIQLSRLDAVQNVVTSLCKISFVALQCRHHAAAVGMLFKLLDNHCSELLQNFCPDFTTSKDTSRLIISTQPYQLANTIVYNSSDILL